ncbi:MULTISPECIES: hypothetical protein [Pantoea]|uniref:Colicin V synthesis protein n=1 Tax=Pantoea brenneri TaxID=472694 RepID=A0ABU9MQZ2_9GAMM|nr:MULTISPECIES: hypothetical protein [unclassified Pantoea]KKD30934.1 hypothetical protein EP46_17385 [Pantoea sp. 3.5.1]MDU4128567.1 hypothetical protein [Pantoea sp.]
MRELTSFEMQHVSGAGFFDFVGAVVVGSLAGVTAFGLKWAMSGGSAGGVLGVGLISGAAGLIIGASVGLVMGAMYGALNGWDPTVAWFNQIVENQFDLDTKPVT